LEHAGPPRPFVIRPATIPQAWRAGSRWPVGEERCTAMSKPFDATMRKLIELEPAGWLRFLHIPVANPDCVSVIDSNQGDEP
jgi:hypothetical protein